MIKKILYFTYTRPEYTLNSVLLKGLRDNGVAVNVFYIPNRGVSGGIRTVSEYFKNARHSDLVVVGYDSPALAVLLRPFCRKKIIYNAFLSAYERIIVSRELASKLSLKSAYYWAIDFLAAHCADKIRLESDKQILYFSDLFKVSRKKLFKSWVGVDEEIIYYDENIKKDDVFTVLFRGQFVPEAGAEYVVKAAKLLENTDIKFVVIGGGMLAEKIRDLITELRPGNLELISHRLSPDVLREKMQKCHISLGQLSDHDRLTRTTPLKMFESLAMKLPYLTARNGGAMELLRENSTCIVCRQADEESLAGKIAWAKDNSHELKNISHRGYELYNSVLKADILARDFLKNADSR